MLHCIKFLYSVVRYPAKICRIDSPEKKALIHFEGWNTRFDEWIPFDSEKIRPSTRSVDYKEEKVVKPSQVRNGFNTSSEKSPYYRLQGIASYCMK